MCPHLQLSEPSKGESHLPADPKPGQSYPDEEPSVAEHPCGEHVGRAGAEGGEVPCHWAGQLRLLGLHRGPGGRTGRPQRPALFVRRIRAEYLSAVELNTW